MSYQLRYYQKEVVDLMLNTKEGERKLIYLPTAAGKTICFSSYTNQAEGRTLLIVPSSELREQTEEKLKAFDPEMDIGSVQASLNETSNKVIIATRQSLTHSKSNRIEDMLKHGNFTSLIFDECHQAIDQMNKIINRIKNSNVKVFGFSATPFAPKLTTIFNGIAYQKSILTMIMEGYLTEPTAILVESKTNLNNVQVVAGEFNQKELEETVDTLERNRLIVEAYKQYGASRKATLVFCVGIAHLNHVVEEFNAEGIYCKGLDSTYSKEDRKNIIEEFKSGKLPVLVNCGVLTTGFDFEALDTLILARPLKSKILYTQIIGRALRLAEGKKDALIIDINDVTKRHDLMSMSNIFEIKIKHKETVRKAIERVKKEKIDEEIRKKEEEKRSIEREKLKQEELKIVAQRIKLFNRDMISRFKETKLDFYKVDNLTYALSYEMKQHYVIENINEEYIVYDVCTEKENKHTEYIEKLSDLVEAIKFVEKRAGSNSYTKKNSDWKMQPVTDNQRKYCQFAKNRMEAHIFFNGSSIGSAIKKWKRENAR